MGTMERLKKKWKITSNVDFILIMLVFSLAGMGVSFSRRKIFVFLHLDHAHLWVKIVVSLLLIVPLYQLSTLFFGLFLGQFPFFWERQKAIGRGILRLSLRVFNPKISTQKTYSIK